MNALPFLDGEQLLADLETLGRIGSTPNEGGLMRIAFGAADWEGRRWVAQQMRDQRKNQPTSRPHRSKTGRPTITIYTNGRCNVGSFPLH
ncbi:MAG: hypothetical protein DYG89_51655 [Caldilinea sp. CFX5]|nr:hypothetical protein [Caldilinea sp. CFX5]